MSVTSTQYTANSYKIKIVNEFNGSNDIIDAVNTAITTSGWSLYDSVNQTEYSPMATRVYRAGNVDGVTFKYAIVKYDTLKLRINLSCCESWNTISKVATNECWHSDGSFYHGYDAVDSAIFVAANNRHLLLQSFIQEEPSHWGGVFEVERIAPEDISTNSAPCFFYTNSLMFGTPFGVAANNASFTTNLNSQIMVSFPRTPDGLTGAAAAAVYAPTTSRGMWPPYYPSGNTANISTNSVSVVANTDVNNLHLGSWWMNNGGTVGGTTPPGSTDAGSIWGWDADKTLVSTISLDAIKKYMPFGRIYNLSVTGPVGTPLDTTFFSANSSTGWPETGGANTEFIVLPLNGGREVLYSNNYVAGQSGYMGSAPLVPNSSVSIKSAIFPREAMIFSSCCTVVGNNLFVGANNGVYVWNHVNAEEGTFRRVNTATPVFLNANGVYDLIYDGKRSIYGSTNTGLIQIDAITFQVNTITSTALTSQDGCSYLSMDNKYIYAASRAANTRPNCYVIFRSNNTVSANTIRLASANALTVASGFNTPTPDYKGFVYLSTAVGTSSSQTRRTLVANVELGGDGITTIATPKIPSGASSSNAYIDLIFFEPFTDRLYHFTPYQVDSGGGLNAAFYYLIEYLNNASLSVIYDSSTYHFSPIIGVFAPSAQLAPRAFSTIADRDFRGDFNITQHHGVFNIQPRQAGRLYYNNFTNQQYGATLATGSLTGSVYKFLLSHPSPFAFATNFLSATYNGYMAPVYAVRGENNTTTRGAYSIGLSGSIPIYDTINGASNFAWTNGIQYYHISNNNGFEPILQKSWNYFAPYAVGGFRTGRLFLKG